MWDEKAGTFLAVNRDTMEKIPVATIGSWIPLAAGVPTEAMARRMATMMLDGLTRKYELKLRGAARP
jgi:hypothetical protein